MRMYGTPGVHVTGMSTEAPALRTRPRLHKKYRLFLLALPALILVFLFSYLPIHGWLYAFYNYRPGLPLTADRWVGLKWFTAIFANPVQTAEVLRVLRNTIAISLINIALSFLPVIFAIFLLEVPWAPLRKTVQVLTTLPNFISWVLVYSVAFALLSVDNGLVNRVIVQLGWVDRGINFLASDRNVWIKMCLWNTWKTLGWSAIMYLAAVASIDPQLYEAARVDGAGRFRMIWHITVPGILPTFFVLLLLAIANFINNGMDQFYVFQNAINKDHIEVLDLYVYNTGMVGSNFSFATAVSMLKSIVSVFLLFFANTLSRAVRGESII
jgi:putative aldouronate transport system permease protein